MTLENLVATAAFMRDFVVVVVVCETNAAQLFFVQSVDLVDLYPEKRLP